MTQKTILIAGGAGFIGSHVNKILNQAGYQTLVLDNLSSGSEKAVTRGTFIEGDLADSNRLDAIFSQNSIDAVMHFAALIDVGESVKDPGPYYQNNVANTLNLLQAMVRHSVKTFIFSSSAAVYGIPEEIFITEKHPCHPINPYGETKWMVEKILRDFEASYGLQSISLRYFNAAGGDPEREVKNYKKKESNLIPLILRSLKSGGKVTVFGTDYPTPDGTCIRDYIHICDLGSAHLLAMERLLKGHSGGIFNLGNGQGFSVKDVIHTVEEVTGLRVNVINGPRRAGDPPVLVANAEKAQNELGWLPRYPDLKTIIQHAWECLAAE